MSSVALSFPSPPSLPVSVSSPSPPVSTSLSPVPSGMSGPLWIFWGLATMWAAPRRYVYDPSHNVPGLLFGRPPPPYLGRCDQPNSSFSLALTSYPLPLD